MLTLNNTSMEPIEVPLDNTKTRKQIARRLSHRVWCIIWPVLWVKVEDQSRDQIIWNIATNSRDKLE